MAASRSRPISAVIVAGSRAAAARAPTASRSGRFANRAAIPEAGGTLCTYFDPDNAHDAYEIIRGMIEHPERVAALEARIAAEFRCPNWDTTAAAVLSRLGIAQPAAERIGVQSIG